MEQEEVIIRQNLVTKLKKPPEVFYILHIEDDPIIPHLIKSRIPAKFKENVEIIHFQSHTQADEYLRSGAGKKLEEFNLVITDINTPDKGSGITWLKKWFDKPKALTAKLPPVIMHSNRNTEKECIDFAKERGFDFVGKEKVNDYMDRLIEIIQKKLGLTLDHGHKVGK